MKLSFFMFCLISILAKLKEKTKKKPFKTSTQLKIFVFVFLIENVFHENTQKNSLKKKK
jgi:hypothetical protein